jgi:hypothetical protein
MAGAAAIQRAVHVHFGDALKHSMIVGATHWDNMGSAGTLPGPKPQLFFAPDRVKKRNQDWGPGGLDKKLGEAWLTFNTSVDRWMKITERKGRADVERAYHDMVSGKTAPEAGIVLSL